MPETAGTPYLSVVMPVYNEERCVAESLRRIAAFMRLKNREWELVVVSDGSVDRTDAIVREIALTEPHLRFFVSEKNRGKGATVRRGVLAARGQCILVTDADLAAPIKESDKLLAALDEGYDVAIGSRAVRAPGCDVQQSPKRALMGRIFNFLVTILVVRGFKDTQCGFKCLTASAAQVIFSEQKLDGFSFDVEVLYLAKKKGMKVKETAVMWRPGKDSKIRVFRDSWRMLKELFQIRKLHPSA